MIASWSGRPLCCETLSSKNWCRFGDGLGSCGLWSSCSFSRCGAWHCARMHKCQPCLHDAPSAADEHDPKLSKEVWKSNFRQYGELKSRAEKQSQKMKSREEKVESEERRYNCAKVRRKKIHLREMLGKSRNAVFFRGFVCRLVRKVGPLNRRVRR